MTLMYFSEKSGKSAGGGMLFIRSCAVLRIVKSFLMYYRYLDELRNSVLSFLSTACNIENKTILYIFRHGIDMALKKTEN